MVHAPVPLKHGVQILRNGVIAESVDPSGPLTWVRNVELELIRVRFERPYPSYLEAKATFEFQPWFIVVPFPPRYPDEFPADLPNLEAVYEQVRQVVDVLCPRTPERWQHM